MQRLKRIKVIKGDADCNQVNYKNKTGLVIDQFHTDKYGLVLSIKTDKNTYFDVPAIFTQLINT